MKTLSVNISVRTLEGSSLAHLEAHDTPDLRIVSLSTMLAVEIA